MPSVHSYRLPYASANTMPMVNQRIDQQTYSVAASSSFGAPNEPHMGGFVSTPKNGMGQATMVNTNAPAYQRTAIHNNAFYNNNNIIAASIDYRPNFLEDNLRLLREGVRRYLVDPSQESVIIIQHACVAQKSYGNEKR